MAGSDKKQQKMASGESVSGGAVPFVVQDPDVSHFVMAGQPQGLIPRVKLNSDQTTTITTWANPIFDGDTEYFRLQITRAASNEWTTLQEHSFKGELPDDPADVDLIGPQPIDPGGKVRIPKDNFIVTGDGLCCGFYLLIDKAGNISALSLYELMSVALGTLPPKPLPKPTAADATGGELLRSDIVDGGVLVNVPRVTNGKPTDTVVVTWKDQELTPGTPVGGNPQGGINIFMPWDRIWAAYGSTTVGVVDHSLTYKVLRGVEPFPSETETVKVNLSAPGPVIDPPNPEPGNDQLKPVNVVGESGVANVLVASDEDKEVNAEIELVAPLVDDDSYQVMWNGTPIGDPYIIDVTNDTAGDTIEIALDWDDIRSEGPSDAMPVWYELTNPNHANHQEPDPHSSVEIKFLTLEMPEAEPQTDHPSGWITCNHLRESGGEWGFAWKIPANPHMKPGDDVNVEYNGYTDFANPVLVPGTNLKHTFTNITDAQARDGIIWWVGPYATHFLPIWSKEKPNGKGEVTYNIEGKPAASRPTNTRVFLSQGEGSCNIPPIP